MSSNTPIIDLYSALEPEALALWLTDRFIPREARCIELMEANKRFLEATKHGIATEDVAGKATDFARMLSAEVKEIELTRTAIKAPVLLAERQIDGMGRKFSEPLVAAKVEVEKRVTVYMRARDQEIRRVAAEEAARKEAEAQALMDQATEAANAGDFEAEDEIVAHAAEVATAAPPPEPVRLRTQIGSTTALKDSWVYEVVDIAKVPSAYVQINDSVVKAAIRSGTRHIPGLTIKNEPKAAIR